MGTLRLTILTAVLAGLTACGTTLPNYDDDGDTGWYEDDTGNNTASATPNIVELDWSCDLNSGTWTYYARTEGWAGLMTIDIHETGSSAPWTESHDLGNIAWSQDGTWDEWNVSLGHVGTPNGVYPNSTTLFTCGYHSDDSLTWMVTSYDGDGYAVDCAVFGHRPNYWTYDRGYSECLIWN